MESSMRKIIFLLTISFGLTACSEIITIPDYNSNFNQSQSSANANQKYQIGKITVSPNIEDPAKCRLSGPMVPDSGIKYSEYISQAFQDELKNRYLLDLKTGKYIDLNIEAIDVTTAGQPGSWSISIKYTLEGRSNEVNVTHPIYFSNAQARIACPEAAEEFPAAVRLLLEKILNKIAQSD
jgi:hypothetical protein